MKKYKVKRSLEGLKIFPYVAWGLMFGFAFFVYNITTELQDVTAELRTQTAAFQNQIDVNDPQADFEAYANNAFGAATTTE